MRSLLTIATLAALTAPALATTEICGNGIDDDGNGLTDEGCYPTLTSGVCESPLSCTQTGMVSWSTGSLHYDMAPDIAPAVPYGPGIGFRRFYTSMYAPAGANPTTVNHAPMGPGWQHTYMTWVYPYTVTTTNDHLLYHTSSGRDVLYTKSSSDATYNYYTPQAGDHVLSMKLRLSDSTAFLQLLTGETLVFNPSGQIIEIWDTVSPTPNKVLITWTSISSGSVSTVTDASGMRRLSFNYSASRLLTSIDFQVQMTAGSWLTKHTTTYDYSNYVTRDATSGFFVPASPTDWTNLLQGSGIPNPTSTWQLQETSGNLSDTTGMAGVTLTAHAGTGLTYGTTVSGWSRKALSFTDASTSYFTSSSTTWCNPKTTACTVLALVGTTGNPAAERQALLIGDNNGNKATLSHVSIGPVGNYGNDWWNNSATAGSSGKTTATIQPWLIATNPSTSFTGGHSGGFDYSPTWSAGTSATGTFTLGGGAPLNYVYAAGWAGTGLTAAQMDIVASRVSIGPGILTTVTIGNVLAQQYHYTGGYLTQITDGATAPAVPINNFSYSSTTPGQVDLVSTPRGTVGFEYNSSRTSCVGKTMLYFNLGTTSPSSCSIDSDCGTGFMCGGKTGSGSTGKCFLAGRCLTTTTANGESVVTNVDPIGPSGTCAGACTDVAKYTWSATSGLVSPIAKQDAMTSADFTSVTYNSNGLPTQIGYGDNDTDPTNGGTNRTVYYFYDTTYPGRLTEIRRSSDLATGCSAVSTTGCKRMLYSYGTDQQLHTVTSSGYTLDATNTVVTYSNVTTYTHDSNGRISEIDGAISGIKTTFDFYAVGFTTPFASGFLQDAKTYTDATHFLEPQLSDYDFWGHATTLTDPNNNLTCDKYDANRGTITERRHAMAGQTTCTTTDPSDLVSQWTRDSALRLISRKRWDTGCEVYAYETTYGRLSRIDREDNCTSLSEHKLISYTADGQVSEIDTNDARANTLKKDVFAYYASRRLQKVFNPASPLTFTGFVYDAGGRVTEVDGNSSLSKTVNHFDNAPGRDSRVTSVDEFKTTSTSDTWSLLYAWDGAQSQLTDGDSKVTGSTRDDLGRLVRLSSTDFTGNTIRVYDAASNLTSVIEDQGGTGQLTHTFTTDYAHRPLNDDYYGACTVSGGGTAHAEIQRYYDSLPTGVTCPIVGGCSNTKGRLAYVVTSLACSSTYATTDGSLDQQTFFVYDPAGHLVEEYTTDDAGRSADTKYEYTKGLLTKVSLPSTHYIQWGYGTTYNSDSDRVDSISYDGSVLVDTVTWNPFGSWAQYNWKASITRNLLRSRVTRDLAYEITGVYEADYQNGTGSNDQITVGRDDLERVTSRVYSPHNPTLSGLYDSYFLYDEQSRVICETTSSVSSCPTTGSTIKNSMSLSPPFTNAGDWKRVLRPSPGTTGLTNDFNTSGTTYGTSHQVTDVNQSDGTPTLGHTAYGYDVLGNRSYDDNTSTLTHDRRDYTYDGRRNVINVRGQIYVSGAWHYYDVGSGYDHKDRRVYKSIYDETTGVTAQWFFYYDAFDRLSEIRYTPNTASPSVYTTFDVIRLGARIVSFVQIDQPSGTVSKRYVATDETGRIQKLWNYPVSGDASIVWDINQSAWGRDNTLTGAAFQPFLFAGQYTDIETASYLDDGSTIARAPQALNGCRTYDPFTGGYLQTDPLVPETRSSYTYAHSNPVGQDDPSGAGKVYEADGFGRLTGVWDCDDVIEGSDGENGEIVMGGHNCEFTKIWTFAGPNDPNKPGGGGTSGGGGGGNGDNQNGPTMYDPGSGIVRAWSCLCTCSFQCSTEYGFSVSVSQPMNFLTYGDEVEVDFESDIRCQGQGEQFCDLEFPGQGGGKYNADCACNDFDPFMLN